MLGKVAIDVLADLMLSLIRIDHYFNICFLCYRVNTCDGNQDNKYWEWKAIIFHDMLVKEGYALHLQVPIKNKCNLYIYQM